MLYIYFIYQQVFAYLWIRGNPPTSQKLLIHPAPGTISFTLKKV